MTQEEKREIIVTFISNNYERLHIVTKGFVKNEAEVDDLLQSSLESILLMKKFPDHIFEYDKIFQYIYGIMRRRYYCKSFKFQDKYGITVYDVEQPIEDEIDNDNEEYLNLNTKLIIEFIDELVETKELHWYPAKLFKMFYFPQDFINFDDYDVTEHQQYQLIYKMSYRKLGKLTGINYQSIRYHVMNVMEMVKQFVKELEITE